MDIQYIVGGIPIMVGDHLLKPSTTQKWTLTNVGKCHIRLCWAWHIMLILTLNTVPLSRASNTFASISNANAPPVNQNDEITLYQIGRYISSNEAAWRLFGFPIHERDPAVIQLAVHLENSQRVFFTNETAINLAKNPPNGICRNITLFRSTTLFHMGMYACMLKLYSKTNSPTLRYSVDYMFPIPTRGIVG